MTDAADAVTVGPIADRLLSVVKARIESGDLVLPIYPEAAKKVRKLTANGKADTTQIVQVLEQDPLLAIQVVQAAGNGDAAVTVNDAVNRLGYDKLKPVLRSAADATLTRSRNPAINQMMAEIRRHSVVVGNAARDLLALSGEDETDAAYLAGLLHDIGKSIIGAYLLELERALGRSAQGAFRQQHPWWEDLIKEAHRPIGIALAKAWKLPDSVVESIQDSTDYDAGNRLSPANAVRFANALAKKNGAGAGSDDEEEVETVVMVGQSVLDIPDEIVDGLTRRVPDYKT